jgi:peptidyl-prolyl cis-trans isomerase SurA
MRKFFIISIGVALLAATPLYAADVLDRIVASVNGTIILQSDWDDALGYEALCDDRSLASLTTHQRKDALDHLIDRELLQEQMQSSDFQRAGEAEIAQQIDTIRKQYPEAQSDQGWKAVLGRYGLTESELKRQVASQLDMMRLVDARLRPGVNIDSASVESYYNQQLLPRLRQSGANDVPLAEVQPKIKELLTQQKVNQLLVAWLQNLRSGSDIHTDTPSLDSRGELQ